MSQAILRGENVGGLTTSNLLKGIVCAGAVFVLFERLWIMVPLPLWLDETWSAMIATQPDWRSFWREAWLDCNPPLYYLLLKIWVSFFGDSNIAMRLPSLILTTAAAFAAWRWAPKALGNTGAWTWAALILFWMNSLATSVDARGYGLLLLLSTVCCLIFIRLYERLSMRDAILWVAICDLMFLTHYYAATLIAAQGLLLLFRHRLELRKVWPAALIGIPPLIWFAFHLPRLADYARPDVAWYDPLDAVNGFNYVKYVFGHPAATFLPLVLITVIAGLFLKPAGDGAAVHQSPERPSIDSALRAAALSGLLALALALVVGALRASLTARYLVPLAPPVLLGLVLIALQSRRRELTCTLLVGVYLLSSANFSELKRYSEERNDYGYEEGSDFIASYQPTQLIFAWDHPAAKILDGGSLEKIGGYFLQRQRMDVPTTALVLDERDDPNLLLRQRANGERPAVIWLYNTRRKSAASHFPPTFEDDPEWSCRHVVQPDKTGKLGAIACIKETRTNA